VLAPGIGANLEFEDSVGGGVSQLSTTLYNASFFGCYEDVTHTVHALYISRYPMGREATLNYPSIDNKFRNDSNSGVLIRAFASDTSVTVALFGNKEGRSCRAEGPNILETIPIEPEFVDDPTLPVGKEKQISSGSIGYVVENFRIISRPGQPDIRERYVERYSMAKAKIARGTGPPPPTTTTTTTIAPPPTTPSSAPPP
jgi:vancomycin resistance protein YoaR